jgi:Tat-targeted selenate reductase subunit YnfE
VAYKKFRENPEANPLKTPSGKIEIYSSKLAEIAATWELEKDETISPLPVYASTFDGWDAPSARSSRCSCLASTLKPVPTRATVTSTC